MKEIVETIIITDEEQIETAESAHKAVDEKKLLKSL